MLLGSRAPPLQLRQASIRIAMPAHGGLGVGRGAIAIEGLVRGGDVYHGRHWQAAELREGGAQGMRRARSSPLPLAIGHDEGWLEAESRAAEVIQEVQQRRGGRVVVLGRDHYVGIGRTQAGGESTRYFPSMYHFEQGLAAPRGTVATKRSASGVLFSIPTMIYTQAGQSNFLNTKKSTHVNGMPCTLGVPHRPLSGTV